jgi:hypothetical protein
MPNSVDQAYTPTLKLLSLPYFKATPISPVMCMSSSAPFLDSPGVLSSFVQFSI